jgi:uncharacterized membrane protein YphA (DoxX/SURF4 family)
MLSDPLLASSGNAESAGWKATLLAFLDAPSFAALVLRLVVSTMVIHHGLDKIYNAQVFTKSILEPYFSFLSFGGLVPLTFWAYASAFVELVAPIFLLLGFYARPAAFLIFVVVGIFANAFHFAATGLQGYPFGDPTTKAYAFEPSVLVGTGAFYFVFAGPGKYAMREDGF